MRIIKNNHPDHSVRVTCPGCKSVLELTAKDLYYVFGHGIYVDPCPICGHSLSGTFKMPDSWQNEVRNAEDDD